MLFCRLRNLPILHLCRVASHPLIPRYTGTIKVSKHLRCHSGIYVEEVPSLSGRRVCITCQVQRVIDYSLPSSTAVAWAKPHSKLKRELQESNGESENLRFGNAAMVLVRCSRNGPNAAHDDVRVRSRAKKFRQRNCGTVYELEQNDSVAPKPLFEFFRAFQAKRLPQSLA